MNWGYRIAILTMGFVCFMTFLVVSAFRQNFDLVTEDYYSKELQFEDQIEKQKNQQRLIDSLTCVVVGNNVIIKFPNEFIGNKIEGEILFFRPSDEKKDLRKPIAANASGIQILSSDGFSKGKYKVQLDYSVNGTKYYFEKSILIL